MQPYDIMEFHYLEKILPDKNEPPPLTVTLIEVVSLAVVTLTSFEP